MMLCCGKSHGIWIECFFLFYWTTRNQVKKDDRRWITMPRNFNEFTLISIWILSNKFNSLVFQPGNLLILSCWTAKTLNLPVRAREFAGDSNTRSIDLKQSFVFKRSKICLGTLLKISDSCNAYCWAYFANSLLFFWSEPKYCSSSISACITILSHLKNKIKNINLRNEAFYGLRVNTEANKGYSCPTCIVCA